VKNTRNEQKIPFTMVCLAGKRAISLLSRKEYLPHINKICQIIVDLNASLKLSVF
jgi:hypothetical protein